jgi:hypothetical protein
LEIGFVPPAGQLASKTRFGMSFCEDLFFIDRMLQENKNMATRKMNIIDGVDQFYLI